MNDVLDQWHYFVSPVYSIKKPEFLETAKKVTAELTNIQRKSSKMDDIYPVIMADLMMDERMQPLLEYTINTAWNLLSDQGYSMEDRSTYFTEVWSQEHHKYSSMEYHSHNDCQLVAFYFVECPKDPPKLIIHDPRPSKIMMNLPENNMNNLTMATSSVNFTPEAGTLMYANSWLPHSFSRNSSVKPFKFIHMNIATKIQEQPILYPATAEII